MRELNVTAAVVLSSALLWAGNAKAEPPASMTYMTQTPALIACDTRPQMEEVIAAIKAGTLKEKLLAMHDIVDDKGEPVCMYGHLSSVVFGISEHVGAVQDTDRIVDVWVANVGNRNAAFFVLWGELVNATGA